MPGDAIQSFGVNVRGGLVLKGPIAEPLYAALRTSCLPECLHAHVRLFPHFERREIRYNISKYNRGYPLHVPVPGAKTALEVGEVAAEDRQNDHQEDAKVTDGCPACTLRHMGIDNDAVAYTEMFDWPARTYNFVTDPHLEVFLQRKDVQRQLRRMRRGIKGERFVHPMDRAAQSVLKLEDIRLCSQSRASGVEKTSPSVISKRNKVKTEKLPAIPCLTPATPKSCEPNGSPKSNFEGYPDVFSMSSGRSSVATGSTKATNSPISVSDFKKVNRRRRQDADLEISIT